MAQSEPRRILLVQDEPNKNVLVKWIGWIITMTLFIVILLWFMKYFEKPYCDLSYIQPIRPRAPPPI